MNIVLKEEGGSAMSGQTGRGAQVEAEVVIELWKYGIYVTRPGSIH